MYYPSRSLDWGGLCRDLVSVPSLPPWPQFSAGTVLDFYMVRCALWFLCERWNLRPGDEVLMPAYNCGSEVDPFLAYGLRVVFYPVDRRAQIDEESIQALCGPMTRVVYITHYFGWAHRVGSLCGWCRDRGIKVIEDCALSLFSRGEEGDLGTHGDAAVFSLKKSLSVPDGAVLVLRLPLAGDAITMISPGVRQSVRNMLPFVKSTALTMLNTLGAYGVRSSANSRGNVNVGFAPTANRDSAPPMPDDYYFDKTIRNWRMSKVSTGILRRTDWEWVFEKRRENYNCLFELLGEVPHVEPLFEELPKGVCPLSLAAIVPNRRGLVHALAQFGILAYPWWEGYHSSCDWGGFSDARYLKDHVIAFPIHQLLGRAHMEHIANVVQRLSVSNCTE